MKKMILLSIVFSFLLFDANAQYTKLLDFNGANGSGANGSLILSDNNDILYGTASGGGPGTSNGGLIFSINTDGTGYQILHSFLNDINGGHPSNSLVRSGNILYGMTTEQGLHNAGTIFSIHTDGSGYTKLYDFDGNNSGHPEGGLILSGNVLYGMTRGSGGINTGNIFSINTDGTAYTNLLNFNGTNGGAPMGSLTISGNLLFGMTQYGGANNQGVLFSIHTDGTGFNKLIDFNTSNGSFPLNSLTLAGNVLFGTCGGGSFGKGLIFSIHTDGSGYKKLLEFDGSNGQNVMGSLALSGNLLYGSTSSGGTNDLGLIFSIDTSGSGFQNLYTFNTPTGTDSRSKLSISGNMLYGTTVNGGTYAQGVIFSFETQPAAIPICLVTVDDNSEYTHIVWEKPNVANIDSFIIYREITTNNYKQIGAVPYSAQSEFIDTVRTKYFPFTGNPNAGTYRYKLQYRDNLGNYSHMSKYHNTLFVTQSGGTFNWNQYTIEDDTVPLPSLTAYVLYRDDNSTGVWHAIQGISGTQTTVTDPDYSNFPNGRWRIETTWNFSCTPAKEIYSTSRSNIKKANISGIESLFSTDGINIYPNPVKNTLTIEINSDTKHSFEIINLIGQSVYLSSLQSKTTVDVSAFPIGVYLVKINLEKSTIFKKFIKE